VAAQIQLRDIGRSAISCPSGEKRHFCSHQTRFLASTCKYAKMRLRSSSVRLHSLFRQQGERLNFVKNKHYAQTSSEKWTLGKVVKLRCSDNDSIFGLRFYPIFLLYVLLYGLEPVRYGFILAALCQYFYMARIHRLQRVQNGRSRKFSTHQHGSIRSSSAISSEMA